METLSAEEPAFRNVIEALPQDKVDYMPDGKGRTAGNLAFQLASQASSISSIITSGTVDGSQFKVPEKIQVSELLSLFDKNLKQLRLDLAKISDEGWEQGVAILEFPGGKWETTKYGMAWGFIFDAIHHRGQLSTYLRSMGAKVPSIYGGSADTPPPVL